MRGNGCAVNGTARLRRWKAPSRAFEQLCPEKLQRQVHCADEPLSDISTCPLRILGQLAPSADLSFDAAARQLYNVKP